MSGVSPGRGRGRCYTRPAVNGEELRQLLTLISQENDPRERPFSSLSVAELIDHVSDPSVHSGGGTVAALTGASAAGVALLVMRLSAGRKASRDVRDQIDADISATQALASQLQASADRDVQILDNLMAAHAQRTQAGGTEQYQQALLDAAESTLDIAGLVVRLLEVIDAQVPYASRFLASDLGAAAALAEGAGMAALLTARINLELLAPDGPASELLPDLTTRMNTLSGEIERLSAAVIAAAEAAMSG